MKKITIIKFSAEWCNPCKSYAQIFDEVIKGFDKNLFEVKNLDVEKNPDIAGKHKVMSIPTTIILEDGIEKARLIGGVGNNKMLEDFINKNI